MFKKNPLILVIIGIVLTAAGFLLPNGVKLFQYVELIGFYNLAVTICQGLGIGLAVGGLALFIKNKQKDKASAESPTDK